MAAPHAEINEWILICPLPASREEFPAWHIARVPYVRVSFMLG